MSRRSRKDRKNRSTGNPPAAAPEPAPVPEVSEELEALRARLDRVEKDRATPDVWTQMADRHRIEREREIAASTRVDPDSPCQACGDASSLQRRMVPAHVLGASGWLCDPCMQAVQPGWGTKTTVTLPRSRALDRLACLAAGMDEPTEGFAVLAGRYGLTFTLAQDSAPGDGTRGTPWSHLGDLAQWREVGIKAVRRAAAGFGVFPVIPASRLAEGEHVIGRVLDLTHPRGYRLAPVEAQPEPSARDESARLRAEEGVIEAALKDRERVAEEKAQEAARAEERARVDAEYRKARRTLEKAIRSDAGIHRRELRAARDKVLATADTRADFDTIVRGM